MPLGGQSGGTEGGRSGPGGVGPGGVGRGDRGDGGSLNNRLSTSLNPTAIDPIIQAALIQSQAIEQGIPFLEPFFEAGQQGLAGLQEGSTVEGLDAILGRIFGTESFGRLREERRLGVEGQLAAGGLRRSGEGIERAADVPTELGFMIEQLLSGRQSGLADRGETAAVNIADLIRGSAEASASGILGVEERRATRSAQRSGQNTDILGAVIGGLFSAPRLKDNIREIGSIGGLNLYQWDWKPEFKGTLVEKCPTVGFLSTEVKEIHPDLVTEYAGLDVVNYPELLGRL